MRPPVLVDTSAIVGLFLEGDEWHVPAREALAGLRADRRSLLGTTDVFDEAVTALRRWAGYGSAVKTGAALRASRLLRLVAVDDEIREQAWKVFKAHPLPGLSYTDCTSAAVMDKFGLTEVFTFDEDFRKLGYKVLPRKK